MMLHSHIEKPVWRLLKLIINSAVSHISTTTHWGYSSGSNHFPNLHMTIYDQRNNEDNPYDELSQVL